MEAPAAYDPDLARKRISRSLRNHSIALEYVIKLSLNIVNYIAFWCFVMIDYCQQSFDLYLHLFYLSLLAEASFVKKASASREASSKLCKQITRIACNSPSQRMTSRL